MILLVLEKYLKPFILTQLLFHRIGIFWNANSVELNMAFFEILISLERSISLKRTTVRKCFV